MGPHRASATRSAFREVPLTRIVALALHLPSLALAVPTVLQHQGRLHDSAGTPLDGTKSVTLTLFDAFFLDDAQWADNTRTYQGWWIGDDSRSTNNLKSNACQILRPTEDSQWDGELVYFGGDGNNDNGCTGGGSVFTSGHTCDDSGGGVTTNNVWPTNQSDALWGYNCILWPNQGIYKKSAGSAQVLYAMYVR